MTTTAGKYAGRLVLLALVAAVGGMLLGWFTAGYFWTVNELIELVWTRLPNALGIESRWYALVLCTIGGLLVGLGQRFLGDHPAPLDELLSKEEGSAGFDITVLPQALYLLAVSLAFGGALGPELGLVFVSGTIGVTLARLLKRSEAASMVRDITVAAVFSSMFVSPLGGAATAVEDPDLKRPPRVERVLIAVVAGLAALAAFAMVPTPGLRIVANWPAYTPPLNGTDALWAVPLGLLGAAIGLLYEQVHKACEKVHARIGNVIVLPILAGALLGALAAWDSLVLFSGEEGIEELVNGISDRGPGELAALAVVKLLLIAILLGSGWKGGHFYPMLFVATAAALSVAAVLPALNPVVAVAAVGAGVLAGVLRRAVPAAFLVLLMVPASALGVAAVAAVVGYLLVRLVGGARVADSRARAR